METRRFWTRGLAIEVGILVLVTPLLGATVGFFGVNPVQAERLDPVGTDAHLLLDSFPDNTLVVEVAYQESVGPPPSTSLSTLFARINETCSKASVSLALHGFNSTQARFSDADLWALEMAQRQHWPSWGQMSLFYLYLGGGYAPDASVIGVAFRASSIAVFAGTIATDSSLFGETTAVTTTVLIHEFGHELGLVGIVGTAPNEDPAHPYHSRDPTDVMYWQVDSTQIGLLGSSPPTQFDAADLQDLGSARWAPVPLELLPWGVLVACAVTILALLVSRRRELRKLDSAPVPPTPNA